MKDGFDLIITQPNLTGLKINRKKLVDKVGLEGAKLAKSNAKSAPRGYDPGRIAEAIGWDKTKKKIRPLRRHPESKLLNVQLAKAHQNKGRGGLLNLTRANRVRLRLIALVESKRQYLAGELVVTSKGRKQYRVRGRT